MWQYLFLKRTLKQKGNKSVRQEGSLVATKHLLLFRATLPHLCEMNRHGLYVYLTYSKYFRGMLFYEFPKTWDIKHTHSVYQTSP